MTEKEQQLEQFRDAVDRKAEASVQASQAAVSERGGPQDEPVDPETQKSRIEAGRQPDTLSEREKSTGKGKKTADKWNQ